jgi:hypothetical protein
MRHNARHERAAKIFAVSVAVVALAWSTAIAPWLLNGRQRFSIVQ